MNGRLIITIIGLFANPSPISRTSHISFDMASCDQGYICEVCDDEVEDITDSDLYLRFIIGEIEVRKLLAAPERHLRCNPTMSQFIVDPGFAPVVVEGPFSKAELDSGYVQEREELVTRGWKRLQEVRELGIPINQYPLEEFRRKADQTGTA